MPMSKPLGGAVGQAMQQTARLRKVRMIAWGGGGAGGYYWPGGGGGYAEAVAWLPGGTVLDVYVGQGGPYQPALALQPGGWPNGGAAVGNTYYGHGGPGGGRSGVAISGRPLLIAPGGGGGGSGTASGPAAGSAGAPGGDLSGRDAPATGSDAADRNGRGASQTAGGAQPGYSSVTTAPSAGGYLQGGQGAAGQVIGGLPNQSAGGGGDGYYGGSGGGVSGSGNGFNTGGGGSGSGYADPVLGRSAVLTAGSGQTPGNSTEPARGGAGDGGAIQTPGTNGRVIIIIDDVFVTYFGFTGAIQKFTV